MQPAEVSWGGKSDSFVCLFLYVCVGADPDIVLVTFKRTFRSDYVDPHWRSFQRSHATVHLWLVVLG